MAAETVLTGSQFARLVKDLKAIIEAGRRRAREAVARENVRVYWEVGKRITEERLTDRAGYDFSIYEDLAERLEIDLTTLKRSVYFFQSYSDRAPRGTNLYWAHYKELIGIPDLGKRRFYELRADEEGWTRDQLRDAIKRNVYERSKKEGRTQAARPELKRPSEATYVYKAVVEHVVDGDTLVLRIDLGFQVWKEQRIRLNRIDCPPRETQEGRAAFEFVRDRLVKVPFVMVRTNKVDIYGRYVGDVFYSFGEESKESVFRKGRYLNQELLNRGLAKAI